MCQLRHFLPWTLLKLTKFTHTAFSSNTGLFPEPTLTWRVNWVWWWLRGLGIGIAQPTPQRRNMPSPGKGRARASWAWVCHLPAFSSSFLLQETMIWGFLRSLPPGAWGASSLVHQLVLTAVNVGSLMGCSRSWGWAWRGDSMPSPGKAPVLACAVLVRGPFPVARRALPVPASRQHWAASPAASHGWALTSGRMSSSSLLPGSLLPAPTCCIPGSFSRPRALNPILAYFSGFFSSWRSWCCRGSELCMCCFGTEGVLSFNSLGLRPARTLCNLKILECKEGLWLLK